MIPIRRIRTKTGDTPIDYNALDNLPDNTELVDRVTSLEKDMSDLLYKAIHITIFGHGCGVRERGEVIESISLTWAINKTPTALTLDGVAIEDLTATGKNLSNLAVEWDSNKKWTLKATDERGAVSTATTSIVFHNGIYWGGAAEPSEYNSEFILGLENARDGYKALGSPIRAFTTTAREGEYIYFVYPSRYGSLYFWVNGFKGGFTHVKTLSFVNSFGYSETYYIYRSDNPNLGTQSVTVTAT